MIDALFYLLLYPVFLYASLLLGRSRAKHMLRGRQSWKPLGMESGLLGFYALLTSFTLVQSSNLATERNTTIHAIADDMSEILRVSETQEPYVHDRIYGHFRDFYRIIRQPIQRNEQQIAARVARIEALDDSLDADLVAFIASNPADRDRVAELLGKTDRLESAYYRLMHSYNKTVPRLILFVLILFSLFIGQLIGFIEKINNNRVHIISLSFVVMSFIILNVIHDLNNPAIGLLKPDYQSLGEVIRSFRISEF